MRAQAADRLPAVDAGHGQVHQDRVGLQARAPAGPARRGRWRRCAARSPAAPAGAPAVRGRPPRCPPPGCGGARPRSRGARRAARGAPASARAHLGQEQPDAEHRARARRAGHRQLAAHQVGEHLGDGQAQARRRAPSGWRWCRARRARRSAPAPRAPGRGRCPRSRSRAISRAWRTRNTTWPCARELDRVAQQVDQDLAHAASRRRAPPRAARPRPRSGRPGPWPAACSSNMPAISCTQSAKRIGLTFERELAALRCARCPACPRSATAGARRRAGSR